MTTYNSIETAQRNSTSAAGTPLPPTKLAGRERVLAFSWTAISSASADLVFLGTLPKGASVAGGRFDAAAHGTSLTASIGTLAGSTFSPKWSISVAISGATQTDFANTAALGGVLSEILTADTDVYWRFEHDAVATTPDVYGYIKYVVD
jgi:hypothetical protein